MWEFPTSYLGKFSIHGRKLESLEPYAKLFFCCLSLVGERKTLSNCLTGTRCFYPGQVSELESQIDNFEAEMEGLSVKKGKSRPPRLVSGIMLCIF